MDLPLSKMRAFFLDPTFGIGVASRAHPEFFYVAMQDSRQQGDTMKSQTVLAVAKVDGREFAAEFRLATGRLLVTEASAILEDIHPPDSWMMLASLNSASDWGTHPTSTDLLHFLEDYIAAGRRFDAMWR